MERRECPGKIVFTATLDPCPPHILQNHRGKNRHLALPITPQIATRLANPSPYSVPRFVSPTLREGSRRLCNHSSSDSVSPRSVLHPAPRCLVSASQHLYQDVFSALSRARQHGDLCTSRSEHYTLSQSHLPPRRRSGPLGVVVRRTLAPHLLAHFMSTCSSKCAYPQPRPQALTVATQEAQEGLVGANRLATATDPGVFRTALLDTPSSF